MRTTVDIDRELLERAKDRLGANTYKDTIRQSLEDVVEGAEMQDLVDAVKDSDLTWGVDELLAYRRLDRGGSP